MLGVKLMDYGAMHFNDLITAAIFLSNSKNVTYLAWRDMASMPREPLPAKQSKQTASII